MTQSIKAILSAIAAYPARLATRGTALVAGAGVTGAQIAVTLIAVPIFTAATPAHAGCSASVPGNTVTVSYDQRTASGLNYIKSYAYSCDFREIWNICTGHLGTARSGLPNYGQIVKTSDGTVSDLYYTVRAYNSLASGKIAELPISNSAPTVRSIQRFNSTSAVAPGTVVYFEYSFFPIGTPRAGAYTFTSRDEIYTQTGNADFNCSTSNGGKMENSLQYRDTSYTINVGSYCEIAAQKSIDFGTFVTTATRIDATGSVSVRCNSAYTAKINIIGTGTGALREMKNGAEVLPYALYSNSGRTTPIANNAVNNINLTLSAANIGLPVVFNIYASIPQGTAVPPIGAYEDGLIVQVSY